AVNKTNGEAKRRRDAASASARLPGRRRYQVLGARKCRRHGLLVARHGAKRNAGTGAVVIECRRHVILVARHGAKRNAGDRRGPVGVPKARHAFPENLKSNVLTSVGSESARMVRACLTSRTSSTWFMRPRTGAN